GVEPLLAQAGQAAAHLAAEARAIALELDLLEPLLPELQAAAASLPHPRPGAFDPLDVQRVQKVQRVQEVQVVQTVRGPRRVALDPLFAPAFSLLEEPARRAMDSHPAPHSWCLSTREAMAAEICALSLVEHDGLP